MSRAMSARYDLAVLGAGTAGAALAAFAAQAGLSVLLLERRRASDAGARWVNGVAAWQFRAAGLAPPTGRELRGAGHTFHLIAGWGPERVTVKGHDVLDVDMRFLVERLQRLATQAGATLIDSAHVEGVDGDAIATSRGTFRARYVVDASGLAGVGLLGRMRPAPGDLCVAAQEVRELTDPDAAHRYFESQQAAPGDTLCFSSMAGGYSIVNLRLDDEGVSLLAGSIPGAGRPGGRQLIDDFVAKQPWIGPRLFGGARAIPLGRPRRPLSRGRHAVLGDAANQVFAAHGSGIGPGLLAARVLADLLAGEPETLRAYTPTWYRSWGGMLLAADVFRRFSEGLELDDVRALMRSGVMNSDGVRATLEQRLPSVRGAMRGSVDYGVLRRRPRLILRAAQLAAQVPWSLLRARTAGE
ncbi:MAG: FAD-dependent oxidoreductase [Polyangiaceae bacterium]